MKMGLILHEKDLYNLQEYLNYCFWNCTIPPSKKKYDINIWKICFEASNMFWRWQYFWCGRGTIVFKIWNEISKSIGHILYVPKLAKNVLSLSQFTKHNYKVEFEINFFCFCKLYDSKQGHCWAYQRMGPYKLIRTFKSLVVDCNSKLKKNNMWH